MMNTSNVPSSEDEEMAPLKTTETTQTIATGPSSQSSARSGGGRRRQRQRRQQWKGILCCTLMMTIVLVSCVVLNKEFVMDLRDQSSSYIRQKVKNVWSSSTSSSSSSSSFSSSSNSNATSNSNIGIDSHTTTKDSVSITANITTGKDTPATSETPAGTEIEMKEAETKTTTATNKRKNPPQAANDIDDPKSSPQGDKKGKEQGNSNNSNKANAASNAVNDEHKSAHVDDEQPGQKEDSESSSSSSSSPVTTMTNTSSSTSKSVLVDPAPSVLDHRPNLVLHVGPQKTASTTLQAAWHRPRGLLKLLRDDNYRYEFLNPHRGWFDCDVYGGGFHDCVYTQKFSDMLKVASDNHKNLLLSDENLDDGYAPTIRDIIDDTKFKVTVVVVYRRIHETCVVLNKEFVMDLRDQSSSYIREKVNNVWSSTSTSTSSSSSFSSSSNLNATSNSNVGIDSHTTTTTTTTTTTITKDSVSTTANTTTGKHTTANPETPAGTEIETKEAETKTKTTTNKKKKGKEQGNSNDANTANAAINPVNDEQKSEHVDDEQSEQKEDSESSSSSSSTPATTTTNTSSSTNKSVLVDPAPSVLDHRPNLVLHVGPQKTASTTLQAAWHRPRGLLKLLRDDNYRYEFLNPHRGWFDCDVYGGGFHDCVYTRKFSDMLKVASDNRKNLLLSDENLDGGYAPTIRDIIDDTQFKVTVVVVYRRIHEWLYSWYNQINKETNKDKAGNILLDHNGNPYRQDHVWWPDQGGQRVPTFSEWYKMYTMYWEPSELVSQHHSVSFMNAYKPLFDNVVVYNMHQDGDLVTNFMCDVVPNATRCCNHLKNGALNIPRTNGSVKLAHQILAIEARERGLLMDSLTRKEVVYSIGQHVRNNNIVLPRKCNEDVINEIRTWLVESEQYMFQQTWNEDKETNLERVFESYLKKQKLCDVDIEAVFNDNHWVQFFKHLDNRPHLVLHVGPQKTGSSTLQEVWHAPKELLNLLKQDNFEYARLNPHRGIFDCGIKGGRYTKCNATEKLVDILQDATKDHHHLLFSDENLDERFSETLEDVINESKFRVKVVVVYRRIHEWLVSWYNQKNKQTNIDATGKFLTDENGQPIREAHRLWPQDGGVHVPPFSDWYQEFVGALDMSDMANQHPSVHFMNVWEEVFPEKVEVYNMHEDGDLVTNFMCEMIPEATKSCSALQNGMVLPLKNPSVKIEHDIIGVAAYERGLIEKGVTRAESMEQITRYVKENKISLPRVCNKEISDEIRQWFLQSEKLMLKNNNRDELNGIFDSYETSEKLCDVDIEDVLSDDSWIRFFAMMKTSRSSSTEIAVTNPNQSSQKPHLVLHVGPQKSGSSTLQSAWDIMHRELDEDMYNYRHITPEARDFECSVSRFGGFTDCKASAKLKKFISDTNEAGRNLLLTDENLDERFVDTLRDVIDDDQWEVTVVVVYRRIHEWIVSWYNQINKTTNRDSNGNILIDENGNPYREEHSNWPTEGGVHVPPFSEWFEEFTRNWDSDEFVDKHRSIQFFNLYDPLFENVEVYNLHEHMGDNMVKDFMCDIVPEADHSCQKLQQDQITLPKVNPSVNLDHDILAVYAFEEGYVRHDISRKETAVAIADYIRR
eukprot:CAMPEP_0113477406 /NCGR_PEP_ID=MMETSP0014_2-20120614/20188_1 /TAXON_ID=2857 /ORGANISM="Nitzschia sp." /LENGTH=1602 /DNA_ID=CAMNT_0000370493 /DNA_START=55 /DNA_END=4860 /DNA_ORIENTATION=- /assembly_acc=CAM_ASM_000159